MAVRGLHVEEAERSSTVSKSRESQLEQGEAMNSHSWSPVLLSSARFCHLLRHQHVRNHVLRYTRLWETFLSLKPPQCVVFSFTFALLVSHSTS